MRMTTRWNTWDLLQSVRVKQFLIIYLVNENKYQNVTLVPNNLLVELLQTQKQLVKFMEAVFSNKVSKKVVGVAERGSRSRRKQDFKFQNV